MQHVRHCLLIWLVLLLVSSSGAVGAQETAAVAAPESVTTADPGIPVEELELLLKPLTKTQLFVEAQAWQALVQTKAEQIAMAEITVKRQNREIEKTLQIQEEAAKAKAQLEEVKRLTEEVRETGDAQAMAQAEEAAQRARDQMERVEARMDEAVEAAEKTAAIQQQMPADLKRALSETAAAEDSAEKAVNNVKRSVDEARGKSGEALRSAADQVRTATGEAVEATETLAEKAADAADAAQDAATSTEGADRSESEEAVLEQTTADKEEQKVKLLAEIAKLRDERTVLLDQFKAVTTALEAKTDPNDAETVAKIRDYQLYAAAVSGIEVDVSDATSTWLVLQHWLLSAEGGQRWGLNILSFFGILIAAWFISHLFGRLIQHAMKRVPGTSRLLGDFFVKLVRWIVLAIGLIMALAALEVSVGPLLALVGAAGFAIAFALQDSISNVASGLMIMFFRPFDIGHIVEAAGIMGKVDSMNLVSTTIKTFDNRLMLIPNNKVWLDVIMNASAVTERRVDMEFSIGHEDDVDNAQQILEEIVAAHPKVLEKPAPRIRVNAIDASSVTFIVQPWAKRAHRLGVKWDVTREVKKRFAAEGIGGPAEKRSVHLYMKEADRQAAGGTASTEPAAAPENAGDGAGGEHAVP